MILTKYEHACFSVEKDGKLLVVDPGAFTTDLPALESVVAVIVTHEHADHYDPAALGAIIAHNPGAVIYAHKSITDQLGDTLPNHAVDSDESIVAGPFVLKFMGGSHAVIHPDIPVPTNLAIMINEAIYYSGDSFFVPDIPVDTLALPATAPWMKISEAIDFLTDVSPRLAFPTHDAIASDAGKLLADRLLKGAANKIGVTYQRLTDPIEVDG